MHVPIGKLSFEGAALKQNFNAVVDALAKARPSSAKGTYFLSCTISSTMSPGIKINLKELARTQE